MQVALYCRISTDEDLQRYSLVNQEAVLRRHAEGRGWQVAGVFVDRMSGSQANRPGLRGLVDLLAEGEAQAVLVTEQDRLSRLDEIPWAILKQTFRQCGAKLFTLSGEVDFGNEDHEFAADIMALIDRRRRKTIVRQMVRGRAAAARRGEWMGRQPFGYRRSPASKHLEPFAAEAAWVREIFHLFAQGRVGSLRLAARMRNRIPNRFVDPDFIVHVLRNPVYLGDLVMEVGGERIHVPGAHEPIVSRDVWQTCRGLLDARGAQGRKSRLESTVGLAAGMVFCGSCGRPLSPTTAAKQIAGRRVRYRYYRHTRRHREADLPEGGRCRAAHRAEQVDAQVRTQLADIVASPAVARLILRETSACKAAERAQAAQREIADQLAALDRRRERLLQLFLAGEWDRDRLDCERERLEQSAQALEQELRGARERLRLVREAPLARDLMVETFAVAAEAASLPLQEQQMALRGLVERVVVDPCGTVRLNAKAHETGSGG